MSASLRFAPMPLGVLDEPFDHDDSIFELKYDGFRALAHVDSGPLPPHFSQPPPRSRSLCSRDGRALPGQFVPDGEILYTEKPRRFPSHAVDVEKARNRACARLAQCADEVEATEI